MTRTCQKEFYIIVIYPAKCLGINIQLCRNQPKAEIISFNIYANYIKLKILYLAFENENNFRQNLLHGYICKRCADYFLIFCHICTGTYYSYKNYMAMILYDIQPPFPL